jgi:hypothetical protein
MITNLAHLFTHSEMAKLLLPPFQLGPICSMLSMLLRKYPKLLWKPLALLLPFLVANLLALPLLHSHLRTMPLLLLTLYIHINHQPFHTMGSHLHHTLDLVLGIQV